MKRMTSPIKGDKGFTKKLEFLLSILPPAPEGYGPWEFRGVQYSANENEQLVSIQSRPAYTSDQYKEEYPDDISWFRLHSTARPYSSPNHEGEYVFVCRQTGMETTDIATYEI